MKIELEAGRQSMMAVCTVEYRDCKNRPYKKYVRKRGESDFSFTRLNDDGKWEQSNKKISWYSVYEKMETDKKDPKYKSQFDIVTF